MTQDEVIKLAKKAGFGNYAYEAAGIFERFAAMVAAAEREKCTGTQEFVTLPRDVVERAMEALFEADSVREDYQNVKMRRDSITALRAALEQPQRKLNQQEIADSAILGNIESPFNACMHQEHCKRWKAEANQQHQHESNSDNYLQRKTGDLVTSSSSVPAGWKLVPVEPTDAMLDAAISVTLDADVAYKRMLAAAPQPPTTEDCSVVQPQVEQEPVAWQYRMRPDWGIKKDCWGPWQDCTREQAAMYQRGVQLLHDWVYETRQLYTHPQPRREPLTDAEIGQAVRWFYQDHRAAEMGLEDDIAIARAIEAAHNIK